MNENKLRELIFSIKEKMEIGEAIDSQIQMLHESTQMPMEDLKQLLEQEEIDYVVETISLFKPISTKKSKEELLEILKNIIKGSDTEAQMNQWIRILEDNVPYPDCVIDILDEEDLSAEELLHRMLDYKPNIINL